MPMLLLGATISGLLGVACIVVLRRGTKLKEDTALGIVLSVFFGGGIALLGITQQLDNGDPAGLTAFILGKTASMRAVDAWMIGVVAVVCCDSPPLPALLQLFRDIIAQMTTDKEKQR